jgi:hypothetical protein
METSPSVCQKAVTKPAERPFLSTPITPTPTPTPTPAIASLTRKLLSQFRNLTPANYIHDGKHKRRPIWPNKYHKSFDDGRTTTSEARGRAPREAKSPDKQETASMLAVRSQILKAAETKAAIGSLNDADTRGR